MPQPSNFYNLPKDLQEMIVNPENIDKFDLIIKPFQLSENQSNIIYWLIIDVLSGSLTPNKFISVLSEKADLPPESAKQIAYKISEIFFLPVKESLKNLYEGH